jgi:hypothetical protein
MRSRGKVALSLTVLAAATGAMASETITYHYDSRGRLIRVEHAGAINNNIDTNYVLDRGDNRTTFATGVNLAPVPPPAPLPPPSPPQGPPSPPQGPPPPPNQPPVTHTDTLNVARCTTATINVVANDTDPESNYPLTVIGVSDATKGTATVTSATDITYEAGGMTGAEALTYTVQDSLGATSTGTLYVNISSGSCDLGG